MQTTVSVSPDLPLEGEEVRVIIWDLDETFWRGTLTEGGIQEHNLDNEELVKTLAHRGIISSICSKNDFDAVKSVLVSRDMWEYFIFPSVDWTHKGPRIADIVGYLQLRPETILFIDDNPQNRAAAEEAVPGILTTSEKFIPDIASHPRFKGKNDQSLSRLKQYQVLEQRKKDETSATGDTRDFLRTCDITVTIEHDVTTHIDRAIELINRTNQLNFTKIRLSEDILSARKELEKELRPRWAWSGLVHVKDKYGDYGYVGFFLGNGNKENKSLRYFCFSCRTLGMEVETYIYRMLGSPDIKITGEVLSNINTDHDIDWINNKKHTQSELNIDSNSLITGIRLRGGCDLNSVIHYFGNLLQKTIETNYVANSIFLRRDTVTSVTSFMDPPPTEFLTDLADIGVDPSLSESRLLSPCEDGTLIVLSFWGDFYLFQYRHRPTGRTLGFSLDVKKPLELMKLLIADPLADISAHLTHIGPDETERRLAVEKLSRGLATRFELLGTMAPDTFETLLRQVIARAPGGCRVAIILPPMRRVRDGVPERHERLLGLRTATTKVCDEFDFVRTIDIEDCILADNEVMENWHLDRIVYYRIFDSIRKELGETTHGLWNARAH